MVKLTRNIIGARNMVLVWEVSKRGPDVTYNSIPRITDLALSLEDHN